MKLSQMKPSKLAEYQTVMDDLKPYQLLPPLTDAEYAELRADIAERGVIIPVLINHDGTIIDGHHRIAIAEELDIYCPHQILNLDESEAHSMAIALNAHRRQLNQAQKRELLATLIKAEPEKSNRQHAAAVGVDHKTAGDVRGDLEGRGEIPHVDDRTDTLGRKQPKKASERARENANAAEAGRRLEPPTAGTVDLPKRPRKPLSGDFDTAMMAFTNAAKRISKLTDDDRWDANRAAILDRNGSELLRVAQIAKDALNSGPTIDDLLRAGDVEGAVDLITTRYSWDYALKIADEITDRDAGQTKKRAVPSDDPRKPSKTAAAQRWALYTAGSIEELVAWDIKSLGYDKVTQYADEVHRQTANRKVKAGGGE